MLHDKDKDTSKCCPFLACCVLQFFLLTIYKPLLYNIDELQKWWSCSLISVKCTRAVYLLMRYSVISVKCINVCAGQINIWHTISLYTGIPVLLSCADSVKKLVQSSYNISHFIDSINNGPTQKKNWKMTANHTLLWNLWWKCTLVHHSTKQDAFSEFLYMQIISEASFNRPRKLNIENMLLALLFICPCINRQSSGTHDDSEVWAFWVKGHFFKHHLSNLFQCMMFLQLVSSFVLLKLWLFDCPLTICSTCKSSLLVRMQPPSSNGHWLLALFWCRLKTFS